MLIDAKKLARSRILFFCCRARSPRCQGRGHCWRDADGMGSPRAALGREGQRQRQEPDLEQQAGEHAQEQKEQEEAREELPPPSPFVSWGTGG